MDPKFLDSDQYLFISPEDVIHLGTMTKIGAPCITFWIRILHRKLEKANRAQYFRFFHPTLALDSCQTQNAISMANCLEDTETGQFWLLPIHIRYHWMLVIIDPLGDTCYWLDPIRLPPRNEIKSLMEMAFDYYNTSKNRQPKEITWKSIKCPQQPSNIKCGYYVMTYMHDFCMNPRPINWLTTHCKEKMKDYTKQNIDQIRVEWADEFIELVD
ncbi:uncharacterized protein LOC133825264 [Humulus lupulus]|uniref:uncharacterized protein LOC133825264 n=1 Tax=Humulus lupulus TaxID=3486 RepID=UPI002B40CBEF|nr:uncharacterized protein LOC133825264 [Humulus lupulus]